jgi:hypothetical protein
MRSRATSNSFHDVHCANNQEADSLIGEPPRIKTGRIAARTREASDEATAYRVGYVCEYNRNCLRFSNKGNNYGSALTDDYIGSQIDQLFCESPNPVRITVAPARFDPEIAAFCPP